MFERERVYLITGPDNQKVLISQIEESIWYHKRASRNLLLSAYLSIYLSFWKLIVFWLIIDGQIINANLKFFVFVSVSLNVISEIFYFQKVFGILLASRKTKERTMIWPPFTEKTHFPKNIHPTKQSKVALHYVLLRTQDPQPLVLAVTSVPKYFTANET